MTAIIAFFTTSAIGRTLAKIGALVLAVLTFGAWNRRQGAKAQKAKQDAAALDATVKGQEAARKGRAVAAGKLGRGATPQEIKEANDAKW